MEGRLNGFSDDFNWDSLKITSEEADRALFVSEQKRIENIVKEAIRLNLTDAKFKISSKLSLLKQLSLLEELCLRFPKRVWTADSDGRWNYDPKKPLYGSEFGINLL